MLILLVGRLGKQAYIDIRLGSVRTQFSLVEDKNGLANKKCGKLGIRSKENLFIT